MKMFEHDDKWFAHAGQHYYILHINLAAVDKPTEVNKFTPFANALSPLKGNKDEDEDPFHNVAMSTHSSGI